MFVCLPKNRLSNCQGGLPNAREFFFLMAQHPPPLRFFLLGPAQFVTIVRSIVGSQIHLLAADRLRVRLLAAAEGWMNRPWQ
jgi:3-methyladenine DNA glycosylase/8-oxoguanine DNA glycosylase